MDFPETPPDGIVGEAIVKLDIVEPTERHTATVIFLHGSGDQGDTFIDYAKHHKMGYVKWILPSAKTRRCTGAGGYVFPLWFDIHQFLDLSVGPWDEEGVLETVTSVESYFFLTLSFKDPIRAMVGMRIQNCNDAWFGDALCQHQAAFTLAIMYVMDLLLFFLDTFLWYVVWNAVYSILRSFALGLSLWTPWADIYTRLPKRIYAKLKGSVLSCADMFAVVRITEAHSDGLVNEEDGSP